MSGSWPGVIEHTSPEGWDALVGRLGGLCFQAWAWGRLKEQFGWQPFRLATADGGSAAQLLIRRHRGLAVAYVPRGPLAADTGALEPALLDALVGIARSQRAAFLRFEPGLSEDDTAAGLFDDLLKSHGFRQSQRTIQPRSTVRLDLSPSPDELFGGFSEGHRRAVRRAEKANAQVRAGTDAADVAALHQMLQATTQRKGFGIHTAAYYGALCAAFGDAARVFLAEHDGSVVSALIAISWGDTGVYVAGGSSQAGLEVRASHLLQWHALRWARERGARLWDSWGIADARGQLELAAVRGTELSPAQAAALEAQAKRDPLDRLFQFKKGLGGEVGRVLPAYDRVFIRPAYWFWQWRRGEA